MVSVCLRLTATFNLCYCATRFGFFKDCRENSLLTTRGQVHVTLRTSAFYDSWDIEVSSMRGRYNAWHLCEPVCVDYFMHIPSV